MQFPEFKGCLKVAVVRSLFFIGKIWPKRGEKKKLKMK
jgi:hypothetical protein